MINRNLRTCARCNAENQQGNAGNTTSCRDAMKKIQKIDFSIVETVLYLDAYPHCRQALNHYHALIEEQKRLKESMQKAGCAPVCATENVSQTEWQWTVGPWPWQPDAN